MEHEQERISVEEASKLSGRGFDRLDVYEIRLHPSWDAETDTVLFPKGNWLEKFLQTDFGNACLVGLILGVIGYAVLGIALLTIWLSGGWADQ